VTEGRVTEGASGQLQQDLILLADFAYQRLARRLSGLTDEEYLWEPAAACWSVRPAGDGMFRADGPANGSPAPDPPPLTTIAWRMHHLIDLLAGARNATWIGVPPAGEFARAGAPGTAGEAIEQLDRAYALFRGYLVAADGSGLTAPIGRVGGPFATSTRLAFVLHELDELIHHAAEVALLRDVYRATRPA
jgi:hypothetical protein